MTEVVKLLWVVSLLLASASSPLSSQERPAWLDDRLASLVAIEAECRSCISGGRKSTGSGFVFKHHDHGLVIATAYHVIVAADRVHVRFPRNPDLDEDEVSLVRVVAIKRHADLALLSIPEDAKLYVAPYPVRIQDDPAPEKAYSLGQYLGFTSPVVAPADLTLEGPKTLQEFFSGDSRLSKLLRDGQAGVFDGAVEAQGAKDGIAPGSSGGPLVDTRGDLLGIAQGGFFDTKSGARIVWAIKPTELEAAFPKNMDGPLHPNARQGVVQGIWLRDLVAHGAIEGHQVTRLSAYDAAVQNIATLPAIQRLRTTAMDMVPHVRRSRFGLSE